MTQNHTKRGVASDRYRIGMIVPSSNVTMETEIPELLNRREASSAERFTCHASRVRLKRVSPEELLAMNRQAEESAAELADAEVDVLLYACLVAVMVEGRGAHQRIEARLEEALERAGKRAPVVTSAGALVDTLHGIGAERVGMVAPYMPALTETVSGYLGAEGIEVVEPQSLSVADNAMVGRLDPMNLVRMADRLPRDVDALVLSACVQMPSLDAIVAVEERLGIRVVTAATATFYQALRALGLEPGVYGAGRLLERGTRPIGLGMQPGFADARVAAQS